MKILFISNLYPPYHIGGYELGCRDVVEDLRKKGHEIIVLSSNYKKKGVENKDTSVKRLLDWQLSGSKSRLNKYKDLLILLFFIVFKRPGLVFFWNQSGLCHWMPIMVRLLGTRIKFFLSDASFVSWRVGAWSGLYHLLEKMLGINTLEFCNLKWLLTGWPIIRGNSCVFVSEFLRGIARDHQLGFNENSSSIISWGINEEAFPFTKKTLQTHPRLLYVGQISPLKGVHTAIEAFSLLLKQPGLESSILTVVGGTVDLEYQEKLNSSIDSLGLANRVVFKGMVDRSNLPKVYATHDILIFPSEWDEPYAITPLEAMSSGLAVVGTMTGGSPEIFRDGENAVAFAAGEPESCMLAILRLVQNPDLFHSITSTARSEILEKHTLGLFMEKLESSINI